MKKSIEIYLKKLTEENVIIKTIILFIGILLVYTVVFFLLYPYIGASAGFIGILFLIILPLLRYDYLAIILLGLMILVVNFSIRYYFIHDAMYYFITIINHMIQIALILLISSFLKKNRTVHEQYRIIQEANNIIENQKTLLEKQIKMYEEKVSELEKTKKKFEEISLIDELTKLPNRRSFGQHFTQFWNNGINNDKLLTLFITDIDYFKQYNDFYGHLAGDECLKKIAGIFSSLTTHDVYTARFGGEEFISIIFDTAQDVWELAEKIRVSVEKIKLPHEESSIHPYVTVSVGGACIYPSLGNDSIYLVNEADKALYQAKTGGRNKVFITDLSH